MADADMATLMSYFNSQAQPQPASTPAPAQPPAPAFAPPRPAEQRPHAAQQPNLQDLYGNASHEQREQMMQAFLQQQQKQAKSLQQPARLNSTDAGLQQFAQMLQSQQLGQRPPSNAAAAQQQVYQDAAATFNPQLAAGLVQQRRNAMPSASQPGPAAPAAGPSAPSRAPNLGKIWAERFIGLNTLASRIQKSEAILKAGMVPNERPIPMTAAQRESFTGVIAKDRMLHEQLKQQVAQLENVAGGREAIKQYAAQYQAASKGAPAPNEQTRGPPPPMPPQAARQPGPPPSTRPPPSEWPSLLSQVPVAEPEFVRFLQQKGKPTTVQIAGRTIPLYQLFTHVARYGGSEYISSMQNGWMNLANALRVFDPQDQQQLHAAGEELRAVHRHHLEGLENSWISRAVAVRSEQQRAGQMSNRGTTTATPSSMTTSISTASTPAQPSINASSVVAPSPPQPNPVQYKPPPNEQELRAAEIAYDHLRRGVSAAIQSQPQPQVQMSAQDKATIRSVINSAHADLSRFVKNGPRIYHVFGPDMCIIAKQASAMNHEIFFVTPQELTGRRLQFSRALQAFEQRMGQATAPTPPSQAQSIMKPGLRVEDLRPPPIMRRSADSPAAAPSPAATPESEAGRKRTASEMSDPRTALGVPPLKRVKSNIGEQLKTDSSQGPTAADLAARRERDAMMMQKDPLAFVRSVLVDLESGAKDVGASLGNLAQDVAAPLGPAPSISFTQRALGQPPLTIAQSMAMASNGVSDTAQSRGAAEDDDWQLFIDFEGGKPRLTPLLDLASSSSKETTASSSSPSLRTPSVSPKVSNEDIAGKAALLLPILPPPQDEPSNDFGLFDFHPTDTNTSALWSGFSLDPV